MAAGADLESGTWVEGQPGAPSAMRVRKVRLEVLKGPDAGKKETIAAPSFRIGRAGCDLVLSDKKISAVHVEVRLEDGGYRLRDLGSTNGTFVWGMRVVEAFIGPRWRELYATALAEGYRFLSFGDAMLLERAGER